MKCLDEHVAVIKVACSESTRIIHPGIYRFNKSTPLKCLLVKENTPIKRVKILPSYYHFWHGLFEPDYMYEEGDVVVICDCDVTPPDNSITKTFTNLSRYRRKRYGFF